MGKLSQSQYRRYYSTNLAARDAFIERKQNGLGLSDRVWQYTNGFKTEMEMGLDLGIRNGLSADEISRDLRQYLQHPDMLFRRVRDEHGILHLSKRAAAFHPGQGVYRSSYLNARRLAVTETNAAYRTADHERWQNLDFVVGIEIHLSGNHTCKGRDGKPHAFTDICDELAGKYPKDFKFTGWHPHCRCYATTILKTEEEMAADDEKILRGEPVSDESVNEVKDVPDGFKDWVDNNSVRIVKNSNLPMFIKDNPQYIIAEANKYPSTKIADMIGHEHFWEYASRLNGESASDRLSDLYNQLLANEDKMSDMGKAMLINQIKEKAARLTYIDLKETGVIGKDWVWVKTERNTTLGVTGQIKTTNGNVVSLKEKKMDVMVFRDENGREFAYPIGVSKDGVLFNAQDASRIIQELPPYLREGIKRVAFFDTDNPWDPYWRVEYNNPNHVSLATDGGNVTFWRKPTDFKGTISHEAGHILDGDGKHKISSSKGWHDAVALDDEIYKSYPVRGRVSKYAQTNDAEDFAESMRLYITSHDYLKNCFPNRAAFIRKMAQQLSGHSPKIP